MAFSILYNNDPTADIIALLAHINEFTKGLGIEKPSIHPEVCMGIFQGMRQDFPYKEGVEKSSAFKQVANFLTYFVANKPMPNPFPAGVIGDKLASISNHQNAIVGFQIAVDSLQGAIIKKDGEVRRLEKRIELSQHSYVDIIDALSEATPSMHFKLVTVLLEQLAYKSNPGCQYRVVGP